MNEDASYIYKPDTCISKAFVKCNGQDRVAHAITQPQVHVFDLICHSKYVEIKYTVT